MQNYVMTAMGLPATPALMKKGYQKELSSGIINSLGTLGILFPRYHAGHLRRVHRLDRDIGG